MNKKTILVISSNILPYGRVIADSLKVRVLGEVNVIYLEINTAYLPYLISRKLKYFANYRKLYANKLLSYIYGLNPDCIINFFGPSPFTMSDFMSIRSKFPHIKIFTWFIDVLDHDTSFHGLAMASDYVGTLSHTDLEVLSSYKASSSILNEVFLLPCFYDENLFYNDHSKRNIDIFFVGSWSHPRLKARRKCLGWLADISAKYNLQTTIVCRSNIKQPLKYMIDLVYGFKFLRYIKPGPIFGQELAQLYRSSSLVLECPAGNQSNANPMRSYEALACGACILFYGSKSTVPSLPFFNKQQLEDQIRCFLASKGHIPSQNYLSSALCRDSMLSRIKVICSALALPLNLNHF